MRPSSRTRICTHHLAAASVLALPLSLLPAPLLAQQAEIAPEEVEKQVKAETPADPAAASAEGWKVDLTLGTTGSLLRSSDVVGQDDGTTLQLGLLLGGAASLIAGQSEWHNTLRIEHSQTRTPLIDKFVKSADSMEIKSLYLYRLQSPSWLGPYVRARLNTSLFPGYAVDPDPTTVKRTYTDGHVTTEDYAKTANIEATSAFEPLLIVESAGAFAEPVKSEPFTLNAKLGAGAQHVLVRDGFALTDDGDTPELEMTQLQDSHSAGAELEIELVGKLATNVTWGALANFFYPLLTSADTGGLEGLELLHTDLGANLSVKLAKWLSLDYVLKARKLPFVLDVWQVQHQLLLTAGFNLL